MIEARQIPGERRNFVHKRLIRAASGFVTSGFNPLAAASGFLRGGGAPPTLQSEAIRVALPAITRTKGRAIKFGAAPVATPMASLSRKGIHKARHKAQKIALKLGLPDPGHGSAKHSLVRVPQSTDCGFGRVWDEVAGKCVFGLGEQAGRDDTPIGDAVMGDYGAGEMPGNMVVNRAICRPGMVLGDDMICYNKSQISNRQREWPRGRRPLLTGGDMPWRARPRDSRKSA